MKPRTYNTPGHAHELTFSCYKRLPLLNSTEAKEVFIEGLKHTALQHQLEVWAFVVMPEHVHVLFWPTQETYDVTEIRKTMKVRCAKTLLPKIKILDPQLYAQLVVPGKEPRREVRFWQKGKGYDRNLFSQEAISRAIDYIHANPFRRELSNSLADWPWSSHEAYVAGKDRWGLVTHYKDYRH